MARDKLVEWRSKLSKRAIHHRTTVIQYIPGPNDFIFEIFERPIRWKLETVPQGLVSPNIPEPLISSNQY